MKPVHHGDPYEHDERCPLHPDNILGALVEGVDTIDVCWCLDLENYDELLKKRKKEEAE